MAPPVTNTTCSSSEESGRPVVKRAGGLAPGLSGRVTHCGAGIHRKWSTALRRRGRSKSRPQEDNTRLDFRAPLLKLDPIGH